MSAVLLAQSLLLYQSAANTQQAHQVEALSHHGKSLTHHGKSLSHHGKSLSHHGKSLSHHGKSLSHHGKSLSHHDKSFPHTRERYFSYSSTQPIVGAIAGSMSGHSSSRRISLV